MNAISLQVAEPAVHTEDQGLGKIMLRPRPTPMQWVTIERQDMKGDVEGIIEKELGNSNSPEDCKDEISGAQLGCQYEA